MIFVAFLLNNPVLSGGADGAWLWLAFLDQESSGPQGGLALSPEAMADVPSWCLWSNTCILGG